MTSVNSRHHISHSSAVKFRTASDGGVFLTAMVHERGLVVDNITAFVHYEPVWCFHKFTEEVTATRRKADSDKAGTAAGNINNCD